MLEEFDRRVVSASVLDLVRGCQKRFECHLGGGAALSGAYLAHRMTGDADLFVHDARDHRELVRSLAALAAELGIALEIVRDVGHLVRARIEGEDGITELDVVHEPVPDLEPTPPPIEGVVVESLADLRANKLTCLLSRSEPRDLVDLLFLDRAGHPPEKDLALAVRKDAGVDPAVLAWLLTEFPVRPLPQMLEPLSEAELSQFRLDLSERLRRLALG